MRKSACNSIFHAPPGDIVTREWQTRGFKGVWAGSPFGVGPNKDKGLQREICINGIFGTQFSTACPYWWEIPFQLSVNR